MTIRPLWVVAALMITASVAGCGGGGEELGAPPVNSTQTIPTSVPATTAPPATPLTTAAPTTTVPTNQPTTTTAVPALTPELEAELIEVYLRARDLLFEGLLRPEEADRQGLGRYWSPGLAQVWSDLLDEWVANGRHAELGPQELQYADVLDVQLVDAATARLQACAVSDAAVYDGSSGRYIDPGLLASTRKDAELRQVDGRWLVYRDRQISVAEGVVGCAA